MAPARPSFFCDPNLKEILLGTKEASPNKDNPPYPYYDYFVPFGSEGLDAFTRRIYGAVRDIAEKDAGPTILIVSHGMAIRRFLTVVPASAGDPTGSIGNCGIVKLQFADGKFTVEKVINPNG